MIHKKRLPFFFILFAAQQVICSEICDEQFYIELPPLPFDSILKDANDFCFNILEKPEQETKSKEIVSDTKKSYTCRYADCARSFKKRSQLKQHNKIHKPPFCPPIHVASKQASPAPMVIQPHPCTYPACEKSFKSRYHLEIHMRSHSGERPYPCNYAGCTKSFKTSSNLARHCVVHLEVPPYTCKYEECERGFYDSSALKRHEVSHRDREAAVQIAKKICSLSCDDCGRIFKESGSLLKHLRTHTGERPYPCTQDDCDKAFKTSSSLQRHLLIHTQEMPYACRIAGCNKVFSDQSSRKRHEQSQRKHEQLRKHSEAVMSHWISLNQDT